MCQGMNIVTKLGLLFALVVVFTLFSFYLGLFMTGPGLEGGEVVPTLGKGVFFKIRFN